MKYIIEIAKEYEEYFKGILICGIADGKFAVDVIAREDLEELTSDYINEHFGSLQDDAYQRGLEDAWEAAKKIFGHEMDGGIPLNEIGKVFGYAEDAIFCTADIIRHNTASEAIAKLKAYEGQKADDEIKVGDVVKPRENVAHIVVPFVVTKVDDECVWGVDADGSWNYWGIDEVTKTDKHYDIDKILEEMQK